MDAVALRHYTHPDLPSIRQHLLDVHADLPEYDHGDPFVQRFPWFVDHWGGLPDFTCVIAYEGSEPAGFIYGAPLSHGSEWWRGHTVPDGPDTTTYAVSELAVRPPWRKTGLARRLHEALLADRSESLAVLTALADTPKLHQLYADWKYTKVGERRFFPDSPTFVVMLRSLP
ncbi:GNAT family N-acetyltransferase [Streptomyces sp. NPDC057638]|uniref:GNAT family N-acetyltransferase n=1 Tax=Streptomyces sp. NPDC057638 TaxID=3346190 RepID=UPI003678DBD0